MSDITTTCGTATSPARAFATTRAGAERARLAAATASATNASHGRLGTCSAD